MTIINFPKKVTKPKEGLVLQAREVTSFGEDGNGAITDNNSDPLWEGTVVDGEMVTTSPESDDSQ